MKVCFDVNVVLGIAGGRADFAASYAAYDVTLLRGYQPCFPMFATGTLDHLLHGFVGAVEARALLGHLMELFDIIDGHPLDCQRALASEMDDYENALIAFAAVRNEVDCIITRDKQGFKSAPIPALSPQEFVALFAPADTSYYPIGADVDTKSELSNFKKRSG